MEERIREYQIYLKEVKNAADHTVESYIGDLKQMMNYFHELGIHDFNNVSETNVNSYLLGLEKQGVAPSSINRKLVSLKGFILFQIKRGYLRQDVTERIHAPKYEKKEPVSIRVEQVEQLLDAPDLTTERGRRDKAMLELLYASGMKVSELLNLRREDVVIKLSYVVVRERSGERLLPFGQAAKDALINYMDNDQSLKENEDAQGLLFLNRFHEPMTRQGFWKILKGYAKQIGISEDITPQVIRNSFAVHMLANGADLYSLKELMGHGDISVTQRYTSKNTGKTREVYQNTHPRGK